MAIITPFAEGARSVGLGGLTVENGTDRIAIYGALQVERTRGGLALALELKALADAMVAALRAEKDLPERLEAPTITTERNPFA